MEALNELDWAAFVIDIDEADDTRLWTVQIQQAGGTILGVERHEDSTYTLRALVLTQAGISSLRR